MAKDFAKVFYSSNAWQRCRQAYIDYRISIDGGMCERCHKEPGYIVHHKVWLTPKNIHDPSISLSFANLEYVCKACHDAIHGFGQDESGKRSVMFDANGDPIAPRSAEATPATAGPVQELH